ncbi:MAG: type II secretion system protein N [Halieaceae bacterium]|jgi:hypothetical protein|nr:type II secretion system protein N [Halieaceae bacterium]
MQRVFLGAGLALLFLLVLVSTAPARLVGYLVPEDQLRLSGFSGTLWEGVASNAAVATPEGWVQLGRTRWSLSQIYLLALMPTMDIESEWGQQNLRANIRLYPSGDVLVRGLRTSFSASLIKQFMPVNLRGTLTLESPRLKFADGVPAEGRGKLLWRQAFWRGVRGSQPLGDYELNFQVPAPAGGNAQVKTLAGPIRIEGSLEVSGREYSVDASLTSDEVIDAELASALELMATPVDGGFRLKFNSEF